MIVKVHEIGNVSLQMNVHIIIYSYVNSEIYFWWTVPLNYWSCDLFFLITLWFGPTESCAIIIMSTVWADHRWISNWDISWAGHLIDVMYWTYDCVWWAGHIIVCDELDIWVCVMSWKHECVRFAVHVIVCDSLYMWLCVMRWLIVYDKLDIWLDVMSLIYDYKRWAEPMIVCDELDIWLCMIRWTYECV